MATYNTGLKVPTRPAPGLPSNKGGTWTYETEQSVDPFSPAQSKMGLRNNKKVPPPRPPPPKVLQTSRSIFGSIKKKQQKAATAIVKPMPPPTPNIPTGTLIDLQSPPNSPIFEAKLKNMSLITNNSESGFEDDFNSLVSSGATTPGIDPWSNTSDFSPSPTNFQKKIPKVNMSKPTIICVPNEGKKPIRPPPPMSEKEGSPPMPSCPPPALPPEALGILINGPSVPPRPGPSSQTIEEEPNCIASYDYSSTHPDDLSFKTGDRIIITEKVSDEWLKGKLDQKEGIFPSSYVDIIVPIDETNNMKVIAVFPFHPETWDDLELIEGDVINVIKKINDDWLYGEFDGKKGQFPICFVQDITDFDD